MGETSLHPETSCFPGESLRGESARPASVGREAAHCNAPLCRDAQEHEWAGGGVSAVRRGSCPGGLVAPGDTGRAFGALGSRPPAGLPLQAGRGLGPDAQAWRVRRARSGASGHAGGGRSGLRQGHGPVPHPGHTAVSRRSPQSGGAQHWHVPTGVARRGSEEVACPSALAPADVGHGGAGRAQTLAGRAPRGGRLQLGDYLGQRLPVPFPLRGRATW